MALAARCPHCRALFRVVADQLKLRGGLVRCGECRKVFDAIGSLSYVDDQALAQERAEAAIGGAALPGRAVAAPASSPPRPREPPAPPAKPSPPRMLRPAETGRRAAAGSEEIRDELAVPTLFGIAEPEPAARQDASEARPVSTADQIRPATEPPPEAVASPTEDEEPEAPSFLLTPRARRLQQWDRSLTIACAPLALLAALQLGLTLRGTALEHWPSLHPFLVRACSPFGCTVEWPEHKDLVSVVGSDLVAIPGTDVIELNAAVRNRATFIMALPAIEITLTDTQSRTVARKVFLPADYLATSGEPLSRIDEGLAAGSELSVRLMFEARGLNASGTGFSLDPFYL